MRNSEAGGLKSELISFVIGHWVMLLIAVPMALLVTALHEGAHAAAVVAQGGEILEFTFLPSSGQWGHVSYEFPKGVEYSSLAISVAPYCLWFLTALAAVLISLAGRKFEFWVGAFIFVWMFAVPLGDIANAAVPYLFGESNDLSSAFGPATAMDWLAVVLLAAVSAAAGFPMQRKLYGQRSLSLKGYAVMLVIFAALVGALMSGLVV